MTKQELRQLAIALLDDSEGICHAGWCILSNQLSANGCEDIIKAVNSSLGRYYLEEDHPFQSEKPIDYTDLK